MVRNSAAGDLVRLGLRAYRRLPDHTPGELIQPDTAVCEPFEWLAKTMAARDRQTGFTMTYDDEAYVGPFRSLAGYRWRAG